LTLDPSVDLDEQSNYAIVIASTAIEDLSGNQFVGIANDGSLGVCRTYEYSTRMIIMGYDII